MKSTAHWLVAAVLMLIGCPASVAQNSDLGVLFGVSHRTASVTPALIRGETRVSMQVNYAWQFHEGPRGRFYIEVPFQPLGGSSAEVGRQITARSGAAYFIVPGIRYQYNLSPRVALYGAGGVGAAISHDKRATVSGTSVAVFNETHGSLAVDAGGGLDFRLTRLWSLRGEVRDFLSTRDAGLSRRNNLAFQFGFALHF